MFILSFLKTVYAISAFLCAIMLVLCLVRAVYIWNQSHPGYVVKKSHWSKKLHLFIEFVVLVICPVVNTIIAWSLVSSFDEVCEEVIEKMERDYGLR